MLTRWLASFALVAAAVSLPAIASAKDRTPVDLVVEGDLPGARAAVVSALGGDLPADARAANMELLVVIERWSPGGRPKARGANDDVAIPEGADWAASFAAAREALVGGRLAAAEGRLHALVRSAPDAVSRARAEKLEALAHDLSVHDAAMQDASPTPPPAPALVAKGEPQTERVWYGWETLICDGASVVTSPILIGIGGYLLCAPIVHLANGEPVKAAASLGLRIGAPLGMGMAAVGLAAAGSDGHCDLGCALAFVVGGGAGIVSAVAIDASLLARKDVQRTEKPGTASTATIVPTGSARSDRFEIGLSGTF